MRLDQREQPQLLQEKSKATVLLVDDEDIIRALCVRALKDYRVVEAQNGRDALEIFDQEPVDLVLSDVMMPLMSGLDLLQAIKERDPDQPVILMTGFSDKEIILRALKAHADDFIQKPINLLQLQTTVQKTLEQRALRSELNQLRRLDRLKTDFLGLVSHKLRTPATSLSLFIQNLASGAIDTDDPSFREALDAIGTEADYLASLIHDLLDYSDVLLHEEFVTTRLNLREIVLAVLAQRRPMAGSKGIALAANLSEPWPDALADRRRITLVLGALLDNAIKFTPPGGEITLSGEVRDNEFVFILQDNGPGISPEEQPKVFEKFYQVDPYRTGQVRGFGLGLFYARQFLHDHGGAVQLNSTPGDGTRVTVRLPRHPRPPESHP